MAHTGFLVNFYQPALLYTTDTASSSKRLSSFHVAAITIIGGGAPPQVLSIPARSCWVRKSTRPDCSLPGRFSGLRLRYATLRDEVMSPPRQRAGLLPFPIKATDPQVQSSSPVTQPTAHTGMHRGHLHCPRGHREAVGM